MDTNEAGTMAFAGDNDGDLGVYDPRSQEPAVHPFNVLPNPFNVLPKKFNTLHVRPPSALQILVLNF